MSDYFIFTIAKLSFFVHVFASQRMFSEKRVFSTKAITSGALYFPLT
jgi:hypothetical protein